MSDTYLSWTATDVAAQLAAAGHSSVAPVFAENEISGDMLPFLTEDHLKEIGIDSIGKRLLVFQYISNLIASPAPDPRPHVQLEPAAKPEVVPKCKGDHEKMVQQIRAAKNQAVHEKVVQKGRETGLTPELASIEQSEGLIPCPVCRKKFSEEGYKHHAPVCERMSAAKKVGINPGTGR
jgi:hypothetical protein